MIFEIWRDENKIFLIDRKFKVSNIKGNSNLHIFEDTPESVAVRKHIGV